MPQTTITVNYANNRPINQILHVLYEKMPHLPEEADYIRLKRDKKALMGGGDAPALLLEIRFNHLQNHTPETVAQIRELLKSEDADLLIGVKSRQSLFERLFRRT